MELSNSEKVILLLAAGFLAAVLYFFYMPVVPQEPTQGQFCDANTPCQENQQCVVLPERDAPECISNSYDPCSWCKEGDRCLMQESYPPRVVCS